MTDEQRLELIKLIHSKHYSIAKASKMTGIPYDNAKAINRTYMREERVNKIDYKQRYQTRKTNSMAMKKKGKGKGAKGHCKPKCQSTKIVIKSGAHSQGAKSESKTDSVNDSLQSPQFMEDLGGDLEMDDGANSEMKSEETSEESKHLEFQPAIARHESMEPEKSALSPSSRKSIRQNLVEAHVSCFSPSLLNRNPTLKESPANKAEEKRSQEPGQIPMLKVFSQVTFSPSVNEAMQNVFRKNSNFPAPNPNTSKFQKTDLLNIPNCGIHFREDEAGLMTRMSTQASLVTRD